MKIFALGPIKTNQQVKEIVSDEDIERLRDHCFNPRDLAIIDLLYSTGIRVGELVNLNISDVNFETRECIVLGKGGKERKVYFDAKLLTYNLKKSGAYNYSSDRLKLISKMVQERVHEILN